MPGQTNPRRSVEKHPPVIVTVSTLSARISTRELTGGETDHRTGDSIPPRSTILNQYVPRINDGRVTGG
ncbi:MAG: hypothetical protein ACFFBD_17420 [Candidatus Hodarchaeota archaeon]